MWYNQVYQHMHNKSDKKGEKEGKEREYLKNNGQNFSNLKINELQKDKSKRCTPICIILKLSKAKDEDRLLMTGQ